MNEVRDILLSFYLIFVLHNICVSQPVDALLFKDRIQPVEPENIFSDPEYFNWGASIIKGEDGKYSYQGATITNLELMKKSVGQGVKVKAAGGVRTLDGLLAVLQSGCSRCGATATVAILEEAKKRFGII